MEHYTVPDEVMREVAETHEAIGEAEEVVDEHFADESDETKEAAALMLVAAPSLDAEDVAELHETDVKDVDALAAKAATVEGRAELAEAADLSRAEVDSIAYDLDLGRVRGVGRKSIALLNTAGIESVGELAEYEPEELAGLLITANDEEHVVEHMPSVDTLAYWIDQSRELPPYLVAIKVLKEMLDEEAYSWRAIAGDDPKKRRADAVMFNRKEGYEVRLMIQKICNTFGFTTVDDVKRVEAAIANELPGNVRSQENVYNWLVNYFETN